MNGRYLAADGWPTSRPEAARRIAQLLASWNPPRPFGFVDTTTDELVELWICSPTATEARQADPEHPSWVAAPPALAGLYWDPTAQCGWRVTQVLPHALRLVPTGGSSERQSISMPTRHVRSLVRLA